MSKILLPALLLSLLLFSGCPRDTPQGTEEIILTEADFYGTWRVERFNADYTITGDFLGEPIDERGTSRISQSDLEVAFDEDGTWSSSGDYTLTVTTENSTDITQQTGVGGGRWSFRNDTVFFDGMRNYGTTGTFGLDQEWTIADFTLNQSANLQTAIDQTDTDDVFGTEVRTQSDWDIRLSR